MAGGSSDDGDTKPAVAVVSTADAAARAEIAAKLKLAAKIPVGKLLNGNSKRSSKRGGGGGGRKLLHKSPEQWSAYEQTPVHMKIVPSARILPIRCPLSSLYECALACMCV